MRRGRLLAVVVLGALGSAQGCSCSDDESVADNSTGGSSGSSGASGSSGSGPDGGGSGGIIGLDGSPGDMANNCPGGCPEGQICSNGVCVTQTACVDDDDCDNDTYCEPTAGCVPWGTPPGMDFDPNCQVGLPAGNFAPTVKCEFSTPPAGDAFPMHTDVQATPVVADLSGGAPGRVPSIIAPFTVPIPASAGSYTEGLGVIRVLRGDNCMLEAVLGGGAAGYSGFIVSSAPVAVADLDGDGLGDIVAKAADGNLVSFTRSSGNWAVLWTTPSAVAPACGAGGDRCTNGWAGPSVHDLDDDGIPEVIVEGSVVDGLTGAIKSGDPPGYATFRSGLNPVLANLDQDPAIELTNGQLIWEWSGGAWAQESYFPGAGTSAPGFVAVADFGAYGAGLPADNPELATVNNGSIIIQAVDGTTVLSAPVPGGGGGAPTIADYDGDDLPELGVAGEAFFTVYDIDCSASPRPNGACGAGMTCDDLAGVPGACPIGVLWSRRTQDVSSNVTGSSVFDFEDDGKAEVVYGDECFVRVYDGTNGDVLFSQFRSSCTWYENPIVADTDGNFRADLVTPSNLACAATVGPGKPCEAPLVDGSGIDTQYPGLRCQNGGDCVSGVCDAGLCRCTATSECCAAGTDPACTDEGLSCAAPPAGTPGTGNTCRAIHPRGVTGIRVYQDANDSWVRSRTIWNQHAYHVTHVNDDTTIPQTSAWAKNWLDPDLNNFRQNVPGNANGQSTPDLTAGPSGFTCSSGAANLSAPVCNRGADPVAPGIKVGFYEGMNKVCEGVTMGVLNPGDCENVGCQWASPPTTDPGTDVVVVADDGSDRSECKEGNNEGDISDVFCKPVQ